MEEAHRMARLDSFLEGTEIAARTRLTDLRQKKRTADLGGRPLARAQENALRFLAVLYPLPRRPSPDPESLAEHPFRTLPAAASEHAPASPRAKSGASASNYTAARHVSRVSDKPEVETTKTMLDGEWPPPWPAG